ncbi:MAG: hypothetical protein JWQ14_2961, partial [Adhaeribacter sp.]|nr:hypothetical protein [Adhaeribacter sp.]
MPFNFKFMNLFFKNSTALLGATLLFSVTSCVTNHQSVANTQLITGLTATTERTTLEGKWNYTMSNPEQEPFSGVLMVQRGGTVGYTGWISISTIDYEAHTKVIKAEIQGQNFTYTG